MPAAELDGHLDALPRLRRLGGRRRPRSPAGPGWPPRRRCPTSPPPSWRRCPGSCPGSAAAARARLVDTGAAAGAARRRRRAGRARPGRRSPSGTAAMSAPVHMAHETGAWNLGARGRVPRRRRGAAAGRRRAAVPRHVHRAPGAGHPAPTWRPGTCTPTAPPSTCCCSPGWPWWRRSPGAAARRRAARGRAAGGCPREAGPAAPARPARRLARSPASSPPARRRRTPTLVSTDPGEGARVRAGAGRGHPRSSARASPSAPATRGSSAPAASASTRGRRRSTATSSPSRCAPACPTTATWSPTGSSRPTRTRSPAPTPSSSATASWCPPARPASAGPHRPGRRRRPAAGRAGSASPAWRWPSACRVLALLCWPGGWASARLRRMATWGAVAVAVGALRQLPVPGAVRRGERARARCSTPSLLRATARLRGRPGAAGPDRAARSRWPPLLRPVWRRGEAAVGRPGRRRRRRSPRAWWSAPPRSATRSPGRGRGWPITVTVVHVAAMAVWLGGLAGLLAGRAAARGRRRTTSPRSCPATRGSRSPSVAALVVSGTVQAVREVESPTALFVDRPTAGCSWPSWSLVAVVLAAAGVSRVWVQQRLGVRRSRPGGRRSLTAHAFAAADGRRRRGRGRGRTAPRGTLQSESAAEHVPALRRSVLVEVAVAAVVLALSAVLVGLPPARAAVAQPVDALLPLQGVGRAVGQRAGVGRPRAARAATRCTSTSSTTPAGSPSPPASP